MGMLTQELFMRMLYLEQKRTERSHRRFVLMLLNCGTQLISADSDGSTLDRILHSLSRATRETDFKGWYRDGAIIGVIFTEVGDAEDKSVVYTLSNKVTDTLYDALSIDEMNEIKLSFHVFPEDWDTDSPVGSLRSSLLVDLTQSIHGKPVALHLKRAIDIAGSLMAIILCLPVLALIALAIKSTSKGPMLFRQVRMGQYGRTFTFLKFRSMYFGNDPTIHEQYVRRFIAGEAGTEQSAGSEPKYKLVADPRITSVGRFLRRTSLDELPQFFNVLSGEMSLVGPRPPITYEVKRYDLWHRQRLLAVKPGITGLWQVEGRSKVKFDEMVRLDIRYARSWSLWLDVKILLQTPLAVILGNGAC